MSWSGVGRWSSASYTANLNGSFDLTVSIVDGTIEFIASNQSFGCDGDDNRYYEMPGAVDTGIRLPVECVPLANRTGRHKELMSEGSLTTTQTYIRIYLEYDGRVVVQASLRGDSVPGAIGAPGDLQSTGPKTCSGTDLTGEVV